MKARVATIFTPGPFGGAERVVFSGIQALKQNNKVNIIIILIKELRAVEHYNLFKNLLVENEISYLEIETDKAFDINCILKIRSLLIEQKIDLIHAHGIKAALYSRIASIFKCKYIVTHHGNTSHDLKVKLYEFLEQICMRFSNQTISVSFEMEKNLKKIGIKSKTIENMLSYKVITREEPNNEKLKLVIIGRISIEKGHADLINALSLIDLPFTLDIIGSGSEDKNIIKLIQDKKLENKITLLGFKQDINKELIKYDALVMPSHREGLPMILIEALCIGVPVIGSKVGALIQYIEEDKLKFDPKSIIQIKESIEYFNINKEKEIKRAIKKSNKYQEQFDPKTWADKTTNTYLNVLSQL